MLVLAAGRTRAVIEQVSKQVRGGHESGAPAAQSMHACCSNGQPLMRGGGGGKRCQQSCKLRPRKGRAERAKQGQTWARQVHGQEVDVSSHLLLQVHSVQGFRTPGNLPQKS